MAKVSFVVLPVALQLLAETHLVPAIIAKSGGVTVSNQRGAWTAPDGRIVAEEVHRYEFVLDLNNAYQETLDLIGRFLVRSGCKEEAIYFGVGQNAYVKPVSYWRDGPHWAVETAIMAAEEEAKAPYKPGDVVKSHYTGRVLFLTKRKDGAVHGIVIWSHDQRHVGNPTYLEQTELDPALVVLARVPELLDAKA